VITRIELSFMGALFIWFSLVVTMRFATLFDIKKPNSFSIIDPWATSDEVRTQIKDLVQAGEDVDPNVLLKLARKEPLDPLLYRASFSGNNQIPDWHKVVVNAEHLLKINPRRRDAKWALAVHALNFGDYKTGMSHLYDLINLGGKQTNNFIDSLAAMGAQQDGIEPLIDLMKTKNPKWGGILLSKLSSYSSDLSVYYDLYNLYPKTQGQLLGSLARNGNWEGAHEAFVKFANINLASLDMPFNQTFVNLDAPIPFNWQLNPKYASYEDPKGLYLRYFGKGSPIIAQQVMKLPAGDYDFIATMKTEINPQRGSLVWTLTCVGKAGTTLMEFNISESSQTTRNYAADVTIPESCQFQRLKLIGKPGSFPRVIRADIIKVSLEKRVII